MAQFISIDSMDGDELGRRVAAALREGVVVLPVCGAYAAVMLKPTRPAAGFLVPFRVEPGAGIPAAWPSAGDARYRAGVERLVGRGAVAVFGPERTGVMADKAVRRWVELGEAFWVSFPVVSMSPGQLVDELAGNVSLVVTGGPESAGPTVVDFSSRPATVDRRGKLGILDVEQELGEVVRLGPGLRFAVLVVCTGNSCRSPMAHGLLAAMLAGLPVDVGSAGTGAPDGMPATNQAIEAAGEIGIELTAHRARPLDPAMIEAADLVLAMEQRHRDEVLRLVPSAARRARLLLSFAGRDCGVDDPVGRPTVEYRRTLAQMRPALDRVAADIRFRLGRPAAEVRGQKSEVSADGRR